MQAMAKLLYSALSADGTHTEGEVNAPSVVAAREQLEGLGLRQVKLRPEAASVSGPAKPSGVEAGQRHGLERFHDQLQLAPNLKAALLHRARRAQRWLLAMAAMVLIGAALGQLVVAVVGLVAAAAPVALEGWRFRRADGNRRLMRHYALGEWDDVRLLAKDLRATAGAADELEFDLDVRLACIYARDHALPEALQRLEPWRKRLHTQPGRFEARLAEVHLMAGDTPGHIAQRAKAHELAPGQALRTIEHALAQARFGSVETAQSLLQLPAGMALTADESALATWARGLVHLRRREAQAGPVLAQAVGSWLQRMADPATWTSLAQCACDHAVALHEAGHHLAARERIAQVWPVLEVHATLPLLRMLEADDLLPMRSTPNPF